MAKRAKRRRRRPDRQVGGYRVSSDDDDSREEELPPAVAEARSQLVLREASSVRLKEAPGVRPVEAKADERLSHPGLSPKAAGLAPDTCCSWVQGPAPVTASLPMAKGSVAKELSGVAAPLPKAKDVITKERLEREADARTKRRRSDAEVALEAPPRATADNQEVKTPEVCWIYLGWLVFGCLPLNFGTRSCCSQGFADRWSWLQSLDECCLGHLSR